MGPADGSLAQLWEMRRQGVHPSHSVSFEVGRYRVKTLDTWQELIAALRLRHSAFHEEPHGRVRPYRLDVDSLDTACDHLGVFDRRSGDLLGCYRMTPSPFRTAPYAARKFELRAFLALPGTKLELGRACVRQDCRNGAVIHLLWRGIAAYVQVSRADYLFGSAALRAQDPREAASLYQRLRAEGAVSLTYDISVRPPYATHAPDEPPAVDVAVPPLFSAYLKAGAKVVAPPAWDSHLGSFEYLTVLPVAAITSRFERRYLDLSA